MTSQRCAYWRFARGKAKPWSNRSIFHLHIVRPVPPKVMFQHIINLDHWLRPTNSRFICRASANNYFV